MQRRTPPPWPPPSFLPLVVPHASLWGCLPPRHARHNHKHRTQSVSLPYFDEIGSRAHASSCARVDDHVRWIMPYVLLPLLPLRGGDPQRATQFTIPAGGTVAVAGEAAAVAAGLRLWGAVAAAHGGRGAP